LLYKFKGHFTVFACSSHAVYVHSLQEASRKSEKSQKVSSQLREMTEEMIFILEHANLKTIAHEVLSS